MDIRRCYLDYLEPLISNYKAARPSNPTGGYGDEGIRRFEDYHGDGNKDGSTAVKKEGRVEHFGITLEKEEEGKYDATAQQDEEDVARIKCYICQRMGHFDTECPNEDQRPTNGATTSRQQEEEDTHSSSSEDFTIIGYDLLLHTGSLVKEMEINMTQLCDLDLMLDDAKILARVISIWMSHPKQRPNDVWSLDVVWQDQMGNRVQATVRNQDIKKFQPILDEGACYRISNFVKEMEINMTQLCASRKISERELCGEFF
ncbi:ARID DNA-binding domain-containing protein [Tanacetum coccineum]